MVLFYSARALAKLDQKLLAQQTYESARQIFVTINIENLVELCDTAIREVLQVIAPEPTHAPSLKAPTIGESQPTIDKPVPNPQPSKPFPLWQTAVVLLLGYGLIQWLNQPPPPTQPNPQTQPKVR